MASASAIVTVRCSVCGDLFDVSDHCERRYRREGRAPVCRLCRSGRQPEPTEKDRRYWLDRFTLDEIREIAEGMFGPRPAR